MDSDEKGESYVDVEIENHSYRRLCCSHCGHEVTVPIYCGDRFCPVCSRPRLARVRRRLTFLCSFSSRSNGYALKFLTLTVQSEPDLQSMLSGLGKSFRRLRQRSEWRRRVLGGAYVFEVTKSVSGWHCHIHAIICSLYFPFERLLRMWMHCSSGRGVFIKAIPLGSAVGYLTKYLVKPSISDYDLPEAYSSLKGYRLFQPFGDWMSLLKKFVDIKPGCPKCGGHCFYPLDLIYSGACTTPVYSNSS